MSGSWRPDGWEPITGLGDVARKKGLIPTIPEIYEFGAEEMLLKIASTVKQKTGKSLMEILNEKGH